MTGPAKEDDDESKSHGAGHHGLSQIEVVRRLAGICFDRGKGSSNQQQQRPTASVPRNRPFALGISLPKPRRYRRCYNDGHHGPAYQRSSAILGWAMWVVAIVAIVISARPSAKSPPISMT